MEHKNRTLHGGRTIMRRLKVTSQNVRLADPLVGEETIGRLGVGPILADQRNTLSHGAPDLSQQFAESVAKPRIPKFASGDFSINPALGTGDRLGSAPRDSIPQHPAHGAPPRSRIRCSAMNHKRFFRFKFSPMRYRREAGLN